MEDDELKIHQLANSIREKFKKLPQISTKCCIYKIPQTLRKANKSVYKPCLISIGPFHHGKKNLQPMQEHKLRYLQNFLKRNDKRNLLDYMTKVREWENEVRECYIDKIELGSEEFNEMVLLDGCFLIEFFLCWFFGEIDENDRIFNKPSVEVVIMRDILLLENQIPFFVLDGLYDIAFGGDENSFRAENPESAPDSDDGISRRIPSFIDLCCNVMAGELEVDLKKFDNNNNNRVLHLVDFVRTCYLPSILRDSNGTGNDNDNDNDDLEFPPNVERLNDAGIKFELARNKTLLDVEFHNNVLRIPRLEVEDHTETLLVNLSAFEQCHYHYDSYIVDYVVLMDVIITTFKDVGILMSEGIIINSLGNTEELAEIFNTICKGTNYQARRFYYSNLCKQLNAYYKSPWHRWRAELKHDYFSNPWTIISVIAAIVLLILTIIQTICTIVSMDRY